MILLKLEKVKIVRLIKVDLKFILSTPFSKLINISISTKICIIYNKFIHFIIKDVGKKILKRKRI